MPCQRNQSVPPDATAMRNRLPGKQAPPTVQRGIVHKRQHRVDINYLTVWPVGRCQGLPVAVSEPQPVEVQCRRQLADGPLATKALFA